MIAEKVTDGLYERFDFEQYMRWYRAVRPERNNDHVSHPLVGSKYSYNGKIVEIKTVAKQWWAGYYFIAVYEDSKESSGTIVIENINSIDAHINSSYDRFLSDFVLVDS